MTEFKRARKPEQKEERRALLLATARAYLLETGDEAALSLNELARRADMAKSNVYRYFESREALLLALLWDEWNEWLDAIEGRLRGKPRSFEATLTLAIDDLVARPVLTQLTSVLPSVLERNLGEDSLRAFKRETLEFFERVARVLHASSPELSVETYFSLTHDVAVLVGGLYPFCHPRPPVDRVASEPEFAALRRDFATDLRRMTLALARGQLGCRVPASTSRELP